MPFRLGPLEIGLILVIILIVFGVGKLPQVGSSMGKAMRAFRQAKQGEDEDETSAKPEAKLTSKTAKTSSK